MNKQGMSRDDKSSLRQWINEMIVIMEAFLGVMLSASIRKSI